MDAILEVKQIQPEDTYAIRHKVLRPHQSLDACKYETDYDRDAFHLGAFKDGKLISIASFYNERNPSIEGHVQYRLRGMATLESDRNQHAGRSLITYAEKLLKSRKSDLLWCNARTTVSDYYKKIGLREQGEIFDIDPIGPHKLMYKKL